MRQMPIDFTKPVRTKSGHAARILCTDLKNTIFPVIAAVLFKDSEGETVQYYTAEGSLMLATGRVHKDDLENIPEEPKRHPHADAIIAWANGAEIEVRTLDGKWVETNHPAWTHDMQYRVKPKEEEVKADNDGWIEWKGGKCPVNVNQRVHVRYRCGVGPGAQRAGLYDWSNYSDKADYVIVAYKVIK
jgi:hypothetical protein